MTDIAQRIAELRKLQNATERGISYGFEQTVWCNAADTIELLQRALRDTAAVLALAADEMDESCEFEGRLTSMKVAAANARAILDALRKDGLIPYIARAFQ